MVSSDVARISGPPRLRIQEPVAIPPVIISKVKKITHVKPVNAAASRASSSRLKLIITQAESVSFRRGELAVKARVVEYPSPHLKKLQIQMTTRRSPQGSGLTSRTTNPQASVPAYSDRLSQLEKDMAEIKDGMIKEVLEKLRLLSYEIEKISRRFFLASTNPTLLHVKRANASARKASPSRLKLVNRGYEAPGWVFSGRPTYVETLLMLKGKIGVTCSNTYRDSNSYSG